MVVKQETIKKEEKMDIKTLREKAGLSREDLASKLKVTVSTIYRWENEEVTPHPVFAEKMKRIFGAYENRGCDEV
jgi:ribosome-binding protein aMBF1 (putative translation factor)